MAGGRSVSPRVAAAFCVIAVTVLAAAATTQLVFKRPATTTAPGEPFGLDFRSVSGSSLRDYADAEFRAPALAVRSLAPTEFSPVNVSGIASGIVVERYETSWPVQGFLPKYRLGQVLPVPPTTSFEFTNGTFRCELRQPGAAFVGLFGRAELATSSEPVDVLFAADPAPLISQSGPNPMHPDERKFWAIDGPHMVLRTPHLAGRVTGPLHLYWTNSTLALRTDTDNLTFESRVWDEPSVAGLGVRHAVWHEMRAAYATGQFALVAPDSADGVKAVAFVPRMKARGISALSLDSTAQLSGTLPHSNESRGSSIWMYGDMDVEWSTTEQQNTAETRNILYGGTVAGTALAYSFGGGRVWVSGKDAAEAFAIVALLIGFVYAARDMLLDGLARMVGLLYSRLDHDRILDHRLRGAIFQVIRENPGIHYLGLRSAVRTSNEPKPMGFGTLTHHLRLLEKFGLIQSRRIGLRRAYCAAEDATAPTRIAWSMLRSDVVRAVAEALLRAGDVSQTQLLNLIRSQVTISRQGLHYRLRRMKEEGLVVQGRDGRYGPAATLHLALASESL